MQITQSETKRLEQEFLLRQQEYQLLKKPKVLLFQKPDGYMALSRSDLTRIINSIQALMDTFKKYNKVSVEIDNVEYAECRLLVKHLREVQKIKQ